MISKRAASVSRLLGMIAFDTGDLMRSREHTLSASALYDPMGEPGAKSMRRSCWRKSRSRRKTPSREN
jgi:hypothetical protein